MALPLPPPTELIEKRRDCPHANTEYILVDGKRIAQQCKSCGEVFDRG